MLNKTNDGALKAVKIILLAIACVFGIPVVLAATLLVVTFCGYAAFGSACRADRSYQEVFYANWEVQLPAAMTELYHESEDSFRGDGIRYTVFSVDAPDEYFAGFKDERWDKFETAFDGYVKSSGFDIPENYLPDFEKPYAYTFYTDEKMYDYALLVYIEEDDLLLVCEFFL